MLTTLKWGGTSVTVGSLAAATTVRVIAGGAGVVCAVPVAGSAIAPSNSSPVVLNCMIASQASADVRSTIRSPGASWNGRALRAAPIPTNETAPRLSVQAAAPKGVVGLSATGRF